MTSQYYKNIQTGMTDFEGFYRRIAEMMPDNCKIVEVGVADGRSALMLADMLYSLGKKFHLTMIDNCDYGSKDQANTIMTHIIRSGFDCIEFMDMSSLDASCKFNDNSLDFVFIDASHKYEPTKADIRLWYRKIKNSSVLAGHDYLSPENPEVKTAVDEVVPPPVLRTEATDAGHGVWWLMKHPEIKMN